MSTRAAAARARRPRAPEGDFAVLDASHILARDRLLGHAAVTAAVARLRVDDLRTRLLTLAAVDGARAERVPTGSDAVDWARVVVAHVDVLQSWAGVTTVGSVGLDAARARALATASGAAGLRARGPVRPARELAVHWARL